jgi:hypothetical protein
MLNVVFTALVGVMLLGMAVWLIWQLWSAVEPRPITDDFLKLLNDSFGRDWRNPLRWPWARLMWAYGFTSVGAGLTAGVAIAIWLLIVLPNQKPLTIKVNTTESFRVGGQ